MIAFLKKKSNKILTSYNEMGNNPYFEVKVTASIVIFLKISLSQFEFEKKTENYKTQYWI